jgi:hypothetical protein
MQIHFHFKLANSLDESAALTGDNLNSERYEANRHFRNKKREYLKDRNNEHVTNSKNKNIKDLHRGINEFKRGYEPRNNLVEDQNGDLFSDPHNILNTWKNYFSQILKSTVT